MQVKNLDKFAKKLKKQYSDAISQNEDAVKEIKFIDGKLSYLKNKYKILMDNLTTRKAEFERMSNKLNECVKIQDDLMHDVKNRVNTNHQQMSRNQKKYARETKELAQGFSIGVGTTCTAAEGRSRTVALKKLTADRNAMVQKLKSSGAIGASLSDMKKIMALQGISMGPGGVLGASDSTASLPVLSKQGSRQGSKQGGMRGSQSTPAL
jgi:predicted nuclease with TOPRIM domain